MKLIMRPTVCGLGHMVKSPTGASSERLRRLLTSPGSAFRAGQVLPMTGRTSLHSRASQGHLKCWTSGRVPHSVLVSSAPPSAHARNFWISSPATADLRRRWSCPRVATPISILRDGPDYGRSEQKRKIKQKHCLTSVSSLEYSACDGASLVCTSNPRCRIKTDGAICDRRTARNRYHRTRNNLARHRSDRSREIFRNPKSVEQTPFS